MAANILTRILAVWGVILSVAVGIKLLSKQNDTHAATSSSSSSKAAPQTSDSLEPKSTTSADLGGSTAEPEQAASLEFTRYTLCAAKHSASSSWLPDFLEGTLAVHCGQSVHLLQFDNGRPVRIGQIELHEVNPQGELYPGPVADSDMTDDGRLDLIIGLRSMVEHQTPSGGAIYLMAAAERGGLRSPEELLLANPLQLYARRTAPGEAQTLWIAHGRSAHHGNGPQIWAYRKDGSPLRTVAASLPVDARVLGMADLDLKDGPEILASGAHQGQQGFWWWRVDGVQAEQQTFFPLGQVTGLAIADVDGGQQEDAILSGTALWRIRATANAAPSPEKIEGTECPTQDNGEASACLMRPSVVDANRDGFADLVSYGHGGLLLVYGAAGGRFAPPKHMQIEGERFILQSLDVVATGSSEATTLIALITPISDDSSIELATLSLPTELSENTRFTFSSTPRAISTSSLATIDRL